MYLIPRMIGVGVYTLILGVISLLIIKTKKEYLPNLLKVYTLVLSIMAFLYVPSEGADLYRIIPVMHLYSNMPLNVLMDNMLTSSTPGALLYYFIIGKIRIDGLLPAVTAFLTYSTIFLILLKSYKKIESHKKDLVLILVLFMSRGLFQVTISNIRTVLAIAIVAWCIYTEIDLEKSTIKNIIFYLVAASLHVMGQFMVIVRICLFLFEKSETITHKLKKIILSVGGFVAIGFYGRSYMDSFIDKAKTYIRGGQNGESYFYFWEALLSVISILILLYLINKIRIYKKNSMIKNNLFISKNMLTFLSIIAIGNLAMIFVEFSFAFRLSFFISIFNIPMGLYCLKCTEGSSEYTKVRNNLLIISITMLIISVTRGDLSSLKFF